MSAIKDGRMPINLDGVERHMLFSLNVMDEVEDRIGSIDNLSDALGGAGRMKLIRWLFTLLLNEGASDEEDTLTEKQVGKMIHSGNMREIQSAIYNAFAYGTSGTTDPPEAEPDEEPGDEDAEDDNEGKNGNAGKGEK